MLSAYDIRQNRREQNDVRQNKREQNDIRQNRQEQNDVKQKRREQNVPSVPASGGNYVALYIIDSASPVCLFNY